MKKSLSYVLIAALSVSMLAGCGKKESKSDSKTGNKVKVELSEVLTNVADSVTDIDEVSISVNGEVDASAEEDKQAVSISGSADAELNIDKNTPAISGLANVKASVEQNGSEASFKTKAGMYGQKEGDDFVGYFGYGDQWFRKTGDAGKVVEAVEQLEDALKQAGTELSKLDKDDFKKIEKLVQLQDKTEKVGKKECYVIAMKFDEESLQDTCRELAMMEHGDLDDKELKEMERDFAKVFDNLKLSVDVKLYFDKKSYVPVKFDADITMKGEFNDTKVDIRKLKFTATLDIDEADIKKVPDDVKDKAQTLDDTYNLGDDDDYGYEESNLDNQDDDDDDDDLFSDLAYQDIDVEKISDSITVGKTTIKIGDSYKKIDEIGYVPEEDEKDMTIESGSTDSMMVENPEDTYDYFIVGLQNLTDKEASYKDCVIYRVNIDKTYSGKVSMGELVLGESTIKDVIKMYPDAKIKEDSQYLYIHGKNNELLELAFDSEDGKLNNIILDIERR